MEISTPSITVSTSSAVCIVVSYFPDFLTYYKDRLDEKSGVKNRYLKVIWGTGDDDVVSNQYRPFLK